MFKNQLQELAQRSCFNLPSYACIREGPDHAPRFKASVNFNGEIFESPVYSSTLRQAEHAAAEAALNSLSARGPSKSLTARVLDETGVYKNLLQETAHRAGLKLPVYTTVRSGPGHVPVFTSSVEIAGMSFSGESARTKKQAEKNAAISAWSSLKRMPNLGPLSQNSKELDHHHRRDENRVIRRRDHQYYQRGRIQRPQNQKRPWKVMDSFSDPCVENCVQNHNNFLSLLPPPPPRTMPRILPPNLYPSKTGVSAIKTMGSSQVQEDDNEWINKISEAIKKPVDGKSLHYNQTGSGPLKMVGNSPGFEDDNEWINKISEAIKKPADVRVSNSHLHGGKSVLYNQTGKSHALEDDNEWINKISEAIKKPNDGKSVFHNQIGGNARTGKGIDILDFPKSSMLYPVKFQSSCTNQMGMSGFNGGQRFAPAVQIRSVIPVCAAPPPPRDANPPATTAAEVASTLGKLKL